MLPRPEYLASLPRKRIAAGALIRDRAGAVCLVQPTYKQLWHLPGGTVEADESPTQGCAREIVEELGVKITVGTLLCVDWIAPDDRQDRDGALQLVYDGGVVDSQTIASFRVPSDELHGFAFVAVADLAAVTSGRNVLRVRAALGALEDGVVPELLLDHDR